MSVWDFRQWIESQIPLPAVVGFLVVLFLLAGIAKWRRL